MARSGVGKTRSRSQWGTLALAMGLVAAVLGGAVYGGWQWYHTETVYTDAAAVCQPAGEAMVREVLWEPPRPLAALINTEVPDYEPRLSWDGTQLYFVRGKAGKNADIWYAERVPGGWSEPQALQAVNSSSDDLGPEPSRDGRELYFYSNREGGLGGYDLWCAQRRGDAWGTPVNLGPAVNSRLNDYGPGLSTDGRRLFFASNRPQPESDEVVDPEAWPATVREDLFTRTYDLYVAERGIDGFRGVKPLNALNTSANEGASAFSPHGDFLYFASDRKGGEGGFDLYRARCVEGVFRSPELLGTAVNTSANELDPGLAQLGYALYFSSDRVPGQRHSSAATIGLPTAESGTPDYNLYYTTSREVFRKRVTRPADVHWTALLDAVSPNLLWALLALLLALLLLALRSQLERHKLGLLARCALASLLLHLLLVVLFNFWQVGADVVSYVRGQGPIRVALIPQAAAADLGGQFSTPDDDSALPEVPWIAPPTPRAERAPVESAFASTHATTVRLATDVALPTAKRDAVVEAVDAEPATRTALFAAPMAQAADPPALRAPIPPVEQPRRDTEQATNDCGRALEVVAVQTPHANLKLPPQVPDAGLRSPATGLLLSPAVQSLRPADATGEEAWRPTEAPVNAGLGADAAGTELLESVALPEPMSLDLPMPEAANPARATSVAATQPAQRVTDVVGQALPHLNHDATLREQLTARRGGVKTEMTLNPVPLIIGNTTAGGVVPAWADVNEARPAAQPASATGVSTEDAGTPLPALSLSLPQPTPEPAPEPLGAPDAQAASHLIVGCVTDAESGQPLVAARVRLDRPERSLIVESGANGRYRMTVRDVPDFFAISASNEGYVPQSVNVSAAEVAAGGATVDFALSRETPVRVVIEAAPTVHHLGNDRWSGRINSRFQKRSEGRSFTARFVLTEEQLATDGVLLTFLAKGMQCSPLLGINGRHLDLDLGASPVDGQFGEYVLWLSPALFQAGQNAITIETQACRGDLDDFEFVNVQFHLDAGGLNEATRGNQ